MMNKLVIVGYEEGSRCQHCSRALKHGIILSDGRTVGATCLDRKLSKPKLYQGKKFRIGSDLIIRAAKVVQNYEHSQWSRFGVSNSTLTFDAA